MTPELSAQPADSTFHLFAVAGHAYFDLFRQNSERLHTTLFARSSFVQIGAASSSDSLFFALTSDDTYGVYDNSVPSFSGSFKNTTQVISAGMKSSVWFNEWSVSLFAPLDRNPGGLFYRFSLGAQPFGNFLSAKASWERIPLSHSSLFRVEDFLASFDEGVAMRKFTVEIEAFPFPNAGATLKLFSSVDQSPGGQTGYSAMNTIKGFGTDASLFIAVSEDATGWVEYSTNVFRLENELKSEDLLFADLSQGSLDWSHYAVGYRSGQRSSPWKLWYSFRKYEGSGIGHMESWPFTALASTVFDNRLYYRFDGTVELHALTFTPEFRSGSVQLIPEAEYFFVRSGIDLEHWEPEFLVFGVKNYALDPLSIQTAHLLKLGVRATIPLLGARVSFFAEQFVPLRVTYRTTSSVSPPGEIGTPGTKTSTDGGRRIGMVVEVLQ
ncbi:MAG: hypothetical protein WBD36_12330 [Bacteroidota bacterium]